MVSIEHDESLIKEYNYHKTIRDAAGSKIAWPATYVLIMSTF